MSGRKAWIVEWQSPNGREPDNPIAAIFAPQLGGETVRERMELIYSSSQYTAHEMLTYMARPKENPYRATFGTLERKDDGSGQTRVPWMGQIYMGHNPFLFARVVANLQIGEGVYPDGSPKLTWNEIPSPVIDW